MSVTCGRHIKHYMYHTPTKLINRYISSIRFQKLDNYVMTQSTHFSTIKHIENPHLLRHKSMSKW